MSSTRLVSVFVALFVLACGPHGGAPIGVEHSGQYHLGPVEWTGSFWNACAPYPSQIETLTGDMLVGLSNELASTGNHCDVCVEIHTGAGRTLTARAITYGVANAPDDLDLSAAAFNAVHQNEFPRAMTWRVVTCPGATPLYLQYQALANVDWTSLWVRNPSQPIDRVEVKGAHHASFTPLQRGTDGTWTDNSGFGAGSFTLRVVSVTGSTVEQTFAGFAGGDLVAGASNFP